MKEEILEHWLEKRTGLIKKEASAVKPHFFPETIHRFRTETKKLRAIIRLIGTEAKHEPALPRAFHKLYRTAGEIRDGQIQLQFITADKRHTLPAFAVWLAHKTGDAARKWNYKRSEEAVQALQEQITQLRLTDPDVHTLRHYYSVRLEKLKTLAQPDVDDEALHEVRKQAKDIQYVLRTCKKIWPEAYQLLAPLQEDLEHLSDIAGAYNDRSNLLLLLAQFETEYETELADEQKAAVARAGKDWSTAKAKERKALLRAIKKLTSRKIALLQTGGD